ncbi:hypothetical protein SLEP1_g58676 [Rubroshorea leprosula]|uniref:Receptor ligand binding region domain-containing protein n=1 Tax=Rubroshorea leprosula TaxID=152421 RepID=A0AAV5MU55_9ROSI|nr:hypothetical protein SLEP1_g58676 [Rubroshorea leprosula]
MEMIPTNLLFCISWLFFVLFCRLLLVEAAVAQNTMASATIPVNVGVVLDLDTWVGKLGLSCINMAISDFYFNHSNYRTRLVLNVKDSEGDIVGAAAAALDLIKNVQVQAVIGPSNSMQANFMIALGNKSQVPIISFSATRPFLISSMRSPYFFRATHNDSSQVKAISAIVQTFRWREAVPIYVDNEFGEGIIPYLSDALEEVNARIPYRSVISPGATDVEIEKELFKLMSMQSRVFIVHMTPDLGSRVFDKATEIGMMSEGYVWIITDGMTNLWSLIHHSDHMDSMQGVLGVRNYVPKSKELENFKVFPRGSPLVADVSRAILNVTESFRIGDIKNAWKKQTNCPDSSTLDSSNSLSLGSFWGLFLVAGVTGVLALVYSAAEFLYEQRDVLRECDPGISIWNRILQVLRNFDQRDLTSHAFRQRGLREEDSNIEIIPIRGAVESPVKIPVKASIEIPVEAPVEIPVENPDDISGAATSVEIEIHHASTNSS